MTWWRDERGGPLAPAADAFVAWRGMGAELEPGASAVRWLSNQLDAFAHDESAPDADDERFVEGGGAFLGMVLIRHHGGQHVKRGSDHRVLLGAFGCFDPFAAIDAALDADDPCAELAVRLRAASAEHEGTGPVAGVVRAFARALDELSPPRALRSRFDYEVVTGEGIEVDLRRVAQTSEGQGDEALRRSAEKLASMLDGTGQTVPWSEAETRLVPRLVRKNFVEELAQSGRGELFAHPIGHGVVATLQLRAEGRARYVRLDEAERWPSHALDTAIANLARASQGARFALIEGSEGAMVVARTGDGLDSARLLLPTLRTVLGADLGERFYVAVPHRDTLLAAAPSAKKALRERAEDLFARAPHAISSALFEVSDRLRTVHSGP